jgi:hypothetical protein
MFDEISLSDFIPWGVAAVFVACALGLLSKSRLRSWLICGWTLLPLFVVVTVFLFSPSVEGLLFLGLLLAAMLLPWAALTLFSYNLVRRVREIMADG